MIIWFASGNIHKKKELSAILSSAILPGYSLNVKTPAEVGLEFGPDETGNSFLENALIKATALRCLLEERRPAGYTSTDPVIADDSGICVKALDGRPGIHSSDYGGKDLESQERNALLLSELGDNPKRGARFVCAMVLYYSPERFFIAQESLEGELVKSVELSRGSGGFGYDPILFIPELGRTVAELTEDEKNRLSHRGKAGKLIGRILC